MPAKIRVLSEKTINQIAAGEVIENPASVVKELVENSLDAQASEICVEIQGGGRQLIRVHDNGEGMTRDDALLCFERHATSKITDVDDILSVHSMGFRGEAIPSIGSISKFSLLTCCQGEEEGTLVLVEGGAIKRCVPAARSPGTTIEVKTLFYNVPVRKKFQKSPTYDAQEIHKKLTLLALGHPHVKFSLTHNNETLFTTCRNEETDFQTQLKERINQLLGKEFTAQALAVNRENETFHLQGFIGSPAYTRPNRTGQYVYVNNRGVTSPLISYAVRDGYGTALPTNRHPLFVLHLTLKQPLVDVNVHPQKREVRLRKEQPLKEAITEAIHKVLQAEGGGWAPESASFTLSRPAPCQTELFREILPQTEMPPFEPTIETREKPPQEERDQILFEWDAPTVRIEALHCMQGYVLAKGNGLKPESAEDTIWVIDQHAAHTRVIFEELLERKETVSQPLLIPHTIETTPLEASLLREHLSTLNKMGIEIEEFGKEAFVVQALPAVFGETDVQGFIQDLVHGLSTFEKSAPVEKEQEKQIALAAARTSTPKEKRLSLDQAQALLNQLLKCKQRSFCPLGHPTFLPFSKEEMKTYFQKVRP